MDRLLREELLEQLTPAREPGLAELLRRTDGRGGILRIDDQERAVIGAEEPRRVERLERGDLAGAFDRLSDGDERRHVGIARAERARDHRPDVRHRHRLRRDVAGVPVILVPRVQDEPEIRGHERADHRALVDDAGDVLEPLRELDVVDLRVDGREGAEHVLDRHARRERRVALRVERLGARHPAGHPEDDDGVGCRFPRRLRRARSCEGSRPTSEASVAPAVAPMKPRRLS